MNKKILITGGSGFLGSHLCKYYLGNNCQVVAVDNLSTGRKQNVEPFLNNKNFKFIECDISNKLPKEVTDINYDIILNMASPASPPHYQRLGLETLMVGSVGTLNMLELARKCNARFFHASTSEVYGDPEVHPQPESYKGSVNCYGPRSMYDEAKRFSEALIYTFREKYGTSTCIARFFNTYGPNMDPNDGRVVSNFVVQALRGEPLTVYGEGNQTRSFCYVADLIEGIVKLVESNLYEPINLGNSTEFTILELAESVQRIIGNNTRIVYKSLPKDDPTQRKPDTSKANQLLDWAAKIKLEDGLVETIAYFKTAIGTK